MNFLIFTFRKTFSAESCSSLSLDLFYYFFEMCKNQFKFILKMAMITMMMIMMIRTHARINNKKKKKTRRGKFRRRKIIIIITIPKKKIFFYRADRGIRTTDKPKVFFIS